MNYFNKATKFEFFVDSLKRKISVNKEDIIFVCIGNNKIVGDSLGPQVGDFLKNRLKDNLVLGNKKKNICKNADLIEFNSVIRNKFIIAIDSAFSFPNLIGEIFITEGPIFMGNAFNKDQGAIGNVSIKAVVAEFKDNNKDKIKNLKKIDNYFIRDLSQLIGNGIIEAIK